MGFHLPTDARKYFDLIDERTDGGATFKTLFDRYYICLVAGLSFHLLGERKDIEDNEFVDAYPQPYGDRAPIIAAMLIQAEMERQAIKPTDRQSIQTLMVTLLDFKNNTLLNKTGQGLLDQYAAGGMNIIRDKIPKTKELETFLLKYFDDILRPQYDDTIAQ